MPSARYRLGLVGIGSKDLQFGTKLASLATSGEGKKQSPRERYAEHECDHGKCIGRGFRLVAFLDGRRHIEALRRR